MKNIDINQVAHLYYHEKKSVYEIAKIFGYRSPMPIYACMKEKRTATQVLLRST